MCPLDLRRTTTPLFHLFFDSGDLHYDNDIAAQREYLMLCRMSMP